MRCATQVSINNNRSPRFAADGHGAPGQGAIRSLICFLRMLSALSLRTGSAHSSCLSPRLAEAVLLLIAMGLSMATYLQGKRRALYP